MHVGEALPSPSGHLTLEDTVLLWARLLLLLSACPVPLFFSFSTFYFFSGRHGPRCKCEGQKAVCRNWFSLSNVWLPGAEFGSSSSGMIFTHRGILLVQLLLSVLPWSWPCRWKVTGYIIGLPPANSHTSIDLNHYG